MRIAFVSAMEASPWGGSEMLWSQAAMHLARKHHSVLVSVKYWENQSKYITHLMQENVAVIPRIPRRRWRIPGLNKFKRRLLIKKETIVDTTYWHPITKFKPDLICISQGSVACGTKWALQCINSNQPYVLIAQSNNDRFWPENSQIDNLAKSYRLATKTFFVSEANKDLLESQIGERLENAEVVRNPFLVSYQKKSEWPPQNPEIMLACVGRMDPGDKGQDLLIQALASSRWRDRPFHLSFYGTGPCSESVKRMASYFGIADKISFKGQVANVQSIWEDNHALVLPSRAEGLPLAIIEACLCERVIITTNVAGNAELLTDNVNAFIAKSPSVEHLLDAMERAWQQRLNWPRIGHLAGQAVRRAIPEDPGSYFADRLHDIFSEAILTLNNDK